MIPVRLMKSYALQRPVLTSDEQGGWSETWGNVDDIEGFLDPLSAQDRGVAAQEQATVTHVFYTHSGVVERSDRISGHGIVVTVDAVRNPASLGHHFEIDCEEIQ